MTTSPDPIHLFVPQYRVEECLAEIRECLEKGWTGLGFKTVAFEEAWKRYTGQPHAHFVSSATAGLHLAVRLFKEADGWSDGDEVITTPITFVSTNHVLLHERLTPVFADVDDYLCLDPDSVEERLTDRTRAVMFVGLGGNSGQLPRLVELCEKRGLRLILDAAHMAGTRVGSRHVGREADAAVFSFHSVKNLPTADGGMVSFRDDALDREARKWSWLGINKDTYSRTVNPGAYKWRYDVEHVGFKYHGNSIMAALGLVGLKYLDQDNAQRRRLASRYGELLAGCREVRRVPIAPGCESSRHLYPILAEERDELMRHLNAAGIFPGVHYRDNTTYPMYARSKGTCPRAAAASEKIVSLPLHLRMEEVDVERTVEAIRKFYGRKKLEPIATARLRLRPLEESDLPLTMAWRNQDRVRKEFLTTAPLAEDQHRAWYRSYSERASDRVYLIEHGGRPIGQIALYEIDPAEASATFGRLMIGEEDALGRGFAAEATDALLSFAFEQLKCRVIRLEVRKSNERAIALYKRCGFVVLMEEDAVLRMERRTVP